MPSIRHVGLITVLGIAAFGCSRRVVVVERPAPGPSTAVTLGVPPGHLPPAGMCRIWIPGRPPGRQARARSCGGVLSAAPAGAMILYRPSENRKVIRVRYVDTKRAGVVVRIRVFEAASGRFLREEKGSRGPSR